MDTSQFGGAGQGGPVEEAEDRRSGRRWMALGLVGLVLGAGAGVLLLVPRDADVRIAPAPPLAPAPAEPAAVQNEVGSGAVKPGPSARARAPALSQSDDFMREGLHALAEGTGPARAWIAGGDVARRAVAVLMGLSEGEVPRSLLAAFAPRGAFEVEETDGVIRARTAGFARYDGLAEWLGALDAQRVAAVFETVEPVLEQAFREVAPPGSSLRQTVDRTSAHLLLVSLPDDEPALVEKGAVYAYADPALEALSPAQKQLLRMGPENARVVQSKLRELRLALGLSSSVR